MATAVRQAAVANLDETGWWQGQDRHWLWTVVTETLTLFRLERSRGKAVVQALLGADWTGVVGSDRYSAYRYLPLDRRQLCWAHLIREFRKIAAYNQHQRPLGTRLLDIATRIFAAWYRFRDGTIDRPALLVALAPLQAEFERALETGLDPPHAVVPRPTEYKCRRKLTSGNVHSPGIVPTPGAASSFRPMPDLQDAMWGAFIG